MYRESVPIENGQYVIQKNGKFRTNVVSGFTAIDVLDTGWLPSKAKISFSLDGNVFNGSNTLYLGAGERKIALKDEDGAIVPFSYIDFDVEDYLECDSVTLNFVRG